MGRLALCQNGGELRFGSVNRFGLDWEKSAEIRDVSRFGETVRGYGEREIFVTRVKDMRDAGEGAVARVAFAEGRRF